MTFRLRRRWLTGTIMLALCAGLLAACTDSRPSPAPTSAVPRPKHTFDQPKTNAEVGTVISTMTIVIKGAVKGPRFAPLPEHQSAQIKYRCTTPDGRIITMGDQVKKGDSASRVVTFAAKSKGISLPTLRKSSSLFLSRTNSTRFWMHTALI